MGLSLCVGEGGREGGRERGREGERKGGVLRDILRLLTVKKFSVSLNSATSTRYRTACTYMT